MKKKNYHYANVNHNISICNLNKLYDIVNSIYAITIDLNSTKSLEEIHYLTNKLHEKINCIYNILLK